MDVLGCSAADYGCGAALAADDGAEEGRARLTCWLAGQVVAVDVELAEVAERREGDGLGPEELLGESLDGGRGDGFNLGDDLVDGEEAAEVHRLAREVGHAGGGGLEA